MGGGKGRGSPGESKLEHVGLEGLWVKVLVTLLQNLTALKTMAVGC